MKRVVTVLALLLTVPAAVTAQTPTPGPAPAAPAQGWAEKLFIHEGVPQTTHDFGTVPRGALVSHRFVLKNIYAVPLQVSTRTSCGCVSATASPPTLQPRETGTIDVVMDARRFTGSKTVSVYVTVGPQFTSTATLTVMANSRADVVFNPGQVTFGVVPLGQSPTQTIDVEYAGVLDWKIESVQTGDAPLEVKVQQLYRKQGGAGYRLSVTLKDAPAGANKWEFHLQTNDPASPSVPVLAEATVQAPLAAVPSVVALGGVKIGEVVTRRVVLRGNQPFRVMRVDGEGAGVTVEVPQAANPVQIVTIKFAPTKAGDVRRQLVFQTDLERDSTASVMVEGSGSP
jgi:hypothetical protein